MPQSKPDIGHWEFSGKEFCPETYFGFLYCITNLKTKQYYLGKKQFRRLGSKRHKKYNQQSNWKTYIGSSEHLKADIKKLGKENFKFEIIDLYKTKGGLYYSECYIQMISDSMTEYLQDEKTPRFYNRTIAAIRYVPKEVPTPKTIRFINKLKRDYKNAKKV